MRVQRFLVALINHDGGRRKQPLVELVCTKGKNQHRHSHHRTRKQKRTCCCCCCLLLRLWHSINFHMDVACLAPFQTWIFLYLILFSKNIFLFISHNLDYLWSFTCYRLIVLGRNCVSLFVAAPVHSSLSRFLLKRLKSRKFVDLEASRENGRWELASSERIKYKRILSTRLCVSGDDCAIATTANPFKGHKQVPSLFSRWTHSTNWQTPFFIYKKKLEAAKRCHHYFQLLLGHGRGRDSDRN